MNWLPNPLAVLSALLGFAAFGAAIFASSRIPGSWETALLLYAGPTALGAVLLSLLVSLAAGPTPAAKSLAGITVVGVETLWSLLFLLSVGEAFRDPSAGSSLVKGISLWYARIGMGLLAALVAGKAGLRGMMTDSLKTDLLLLYSPCLKAGGGLLGIFTLLEFHIGEMDLAVTGMLIVGVVLSFLLGAALDPYGSAPPGVQPEGGPIAPIVQPGAPTRQGRDS